MSTDITKIQQSPTMAFTPDDVKLIRDTICRGADESEFKLFLYQAQKTGLNPLARQIFAVKRWDSNLKRQSMTVQVSIDGFRLIAERSGHYAGQLGPFWCGEDGVWKDVWLSNKPPVAAKVCALRDDFKEPCPGVARFDAYAQTTKEGNLTAMWAKMGDVMIAKCAEALALRKAFPQELSGLYTSDEMAQADNERVEVKVDTKALTESAKAMATELELCDTVEKLDAVVARNTEMLEELEKHLPKWNSRLQELIAKQSEAIGVGEQHAPV